MINISLFGAGFIGSVHASNLLKHPRVNFKYIVDPRPEIAAKFAAMTGAKVADTATALADKSVHGVLHRQHALMLILSLQQHKLEKRSSVKSRLILIWSERITALQL